MTTNVNDRSAASAAMMPAVDLARALMGGTAAMRMAGPAYLPRWPNEDQESYNARLATAVLFPAYQRTVYTLAGKPFSKPITVGDDVPSRIKAWLPDIDLQGRNLDVFASDVMDSTLAYGLTGILIDFPVVEDGAARTQADEQRLGVRPYWVHVEPWQILGWRAKRTAGQWVIEQLRIQEIVEEPDGEFGVLEVGQIRVLSPGKWQTFRAGKSGQWALFAEGTTSLDKVPFVPVYGERVAFMVGRPPMLELAHLNIKHWQSQSDQDTILHVARVPILATIGIEAEGLEITVGSGSSVKLPLGADMKYVEHSGASVGAGKVALDDLKEEMRQAGAELLVLQPGQITATQVATENAVGMCALQRMTLGLQDALNLALQYTAEWIKEPEGGSVTIFNDFGAATLAEASAQLLLDASNAGKLSDETWFAEMQRRGIISADVDYDEEKERLEAQGPALADMALLAAQGGKSGAQGAGEGAQAPNQGPGDENAGAA